MDFPSKESSSQYDPFDFHLTTEYKSNATPFTFNQGGPSLLNPSSHDPCPSSYPSGSQQPNTAHQAINTTTQSIISEIRKSLGGVRDAMAAAAAGGSQKQLQK